MSEVSASTFRSKKEKKYKTHINIKNLNLQKSTEKLREKNQYQVYKTKIAKKYQKKSING